MPTDTWLAIGHGTGRRQVRLLDYLDPQAAETAAIEANRWIKALRRARVDGQHLRDRFTYRGDSLWWFAELYLHKQGLMVDVRQRILALEALITRERPRQLTLTRGDRLARELLRQVATRHGVDCHGTRAFGWGSLGERLRVRTRSLLYASAGLLRRGRRRAPTASDGSPDIAAFIHSAFWRPAPDGSGGVEQEGYIGPVLSALAGALPGGRLHLVGLGPATSYRTRQWRIRLMRLGRESAGGAPAESVITYAAGRVGRDALRVWLGRHQVRRALEGSPDLRQASIVDGYDVWPLMREELTGIALLQFPWSVRAMDEAAAALDALHPRVLITYAEAGGWGRALLLEARRRRIPTVGLQHGFIYRHWLNYLHEPDEMAPSADNPRDRGFPCPDLTLVFDELTAAHLVERGHLPRTAVKVTGSPRLDTLVERLSRLGPSERAETRAGVGVPDGGHIIVVASKFEQVRPVLCSFLDIAERMPDAYVILKCHPADAKEPYQRLAASRERVVVAPPAADLGPLLAAARLIVTVNSTVAVDGMVLGVPSLVLALPNNLSPFVEAGVMAGAVSPGEIERALQTLLYDERGRGELAARQREFLMRHGMGSDGRAAKRAARAILGLARRP